MKGFTILGDEDDIDQAILSICGASEEAIKRFTDLSECEALNDAYEKDLAKRDNDLNDWQTAVTMREGFIIEAEKTIATLEDQLNQAHTRIFDNMLRAAQLKAATAEDNAKGLLAKNAALEAQIKSTPSR